MKYNNNTAHNKNANTHSSFITNSDKAELTSLRIALHQINENLTIDDIGKIISESIDLNGNINKDLCIQKAFDSKVKEEVK
jgi:hypothetical protein